MKTDAEKTTRRLVVNGKDMDVSAPDLAALLTRLGLGGAEVVAELNGAIVPAGEFGQRKLQDGDVIELVRFVGGG